MSDSCRRREGFAPRVVLKSLMIRDGKTVPPLSIFHTAAQVNGDRFLSNHVAHCVPGAT